MAVPVTLLAYIKQGQSLPTFEYGLLAANDAAQATAFNNAKTSWNGSVALISSAQSSVNQPIVWARLYSPFPAGGYAGPFTQPDPTDTDNEFGLGSGVAPSTNVYEDVLGSPAVSSAVAVHAAVANALH